MAALQTDELLASPHELDRESAAPSRKRLDVGLPREEEPPEARLAVAEGLVDA